jgi:hypothetical protein
MNDLKKQSEAREDESAHRSLLDSLFGGLFNYYLTTLVVVLAIMFAFDFVQLSTRHRDAKRIDLLNCFATWDGLFYERIVND